jgi:hypothetical protein
VHKTHSAEGVRTLVIWPLGGEVAGFAESGMRVVDFGAEGIQVSIVCAGIVIDRPLGGLLQG